MTHRTLILIIVGLIVFFLFPLFPVAQVVGKPVLSDSDTIKRRYPERLLTDFPIIYNDTAYSTKDYHVVFRAVFTQCRTRKVKVTNPSPLPCPADTMMVRFKRHKGHRHENVISHNDMSETHRK